jgi:hypothetical protein
VFHHSLPHYLSDDIERIQQRALKIILPDLSYNEALAKSGPFITLTKGGKHCAIKDLAEL